MRKLSEDQRGPRRPDLLTKYSEIHWIGSSISGIGKVANGNTMRDLESLSLVNSNINAGF